MISKKLALSIAIIFGAQGLWGIDANTVQELPSITQRVDATPVAVCEVTLKRVHDQEIEHNKAILKQELFYKNMVRAGLKTVAAAGILYALYGYIKPWVSTAPERLPEPSMPAPENTPDYLSALDACVKIHGVKISALENSISPSWFSWQWFKNNAASIANSLFAGSILSLGATAVGDFNKAVMHPDTLEWFVQNKTNLGDLVPYQLDLRMTSMMDFHMMAIIQKNQDRIKKSTIEELRDYLSVLEAGDQMSQDDKAMNGYLIKSTCNSMVISLTAILGFMALKQDAVSAGIAVEIESLIRCMRNHANAFCDKLEVILADISFDGLKKKQEAVSALSSLKGELSRLLKRFMAIEREQGV